MRSWKKRWEGGKIMEGQVMDNQMMGKEREHASEEREGRQAGK